MNRTVYQAKQDAQKACAAEIELMGAKLDALNEQLEALREQLGAGTASSKISWVNVANLKRINSLLSEAAGEPSN